jgi:5-methylthioadenosine/S-adenosylhomocysteine deaminase
MRPNTIARASIVVPLLAGIVALSLCPGAAAAPQAPEPIDLLVDGGTIITMDASRRIIQDGAVANRGDTIVALGPSSEIVARYAPASRLHTRGHLVLPGLINGHNHAAMTLFRGLGDDLPLEEWLKDYIFPAEARNVDEEFVIWGTRLAALEMIRSGTTTFADMYYFEDAVAQATKEAGIRGVVAEAIIEPPAPDNKTPADALAYTERFLKRWQGDPLIRAAVAPHSVYLLSEADLRSAFALARRYDAPILILSETEREVADSRSKFGFSPPAYLDHLGLLGADVIGAHCVWVDAADIALLVARGVGCVHNPSSNTMLASGVAPVGQMLAAGMRLGLGTDGPAGSNNDLGMVEEMDLAAKLQKVTRRDPVALSAEQALEMATIGGARAAHGDGNRIARGREEGRPHRARP